MKRLLLPALGDSVATFALGFVWHLVWFKECYERHPLRRCHSGGSAQHLRHTRLQP